MNITELRQVLGDNIRGRRDEVGLTQAKLAELAGTSQAFIAQIEAGIRSVSLEIIGSLATSLRTVPQALLTPDMFPPPERSVRAKATQSRSA